MNLFVRRGFVDEKLLEILDQFDLNIRNAYRGRGATICVTNQGVKLLKEFKGSAGKLMDEYELKKGLIENGFWNVDQYVRNRQGTFFVQDRYKVIYIMKDYFEGKECDIRNLFDIRLAGMNLAQFHKAASKLIVSERTKLGYQPLIEQYQKRNAELKRVRNYMSRVQKKSEFELTYILQYNVFWNQAKEAVELLNDMGRFLQNQRLGICHGEYTHHNILKICEGAATVNLEHFCYQNQILDLHQFLRKALEKNDYSMSVAKELISGYESVLPLEREDYQMLYVMLSYPEKFYKISNHYYNGKKCWIPPKTVEKLMDTLKQNEKREIFLGSFQKEYLQ